MSTGNPHKIHNGYQRSQEKLPASKLIAQAHQEEIERIHDLFCDEMDADFIFFSRR